jgi:hypothetical protein
MVVVHLRKGKAFESEVDCVMSRAEMLSRGFTAHARNFDINIRNDALPRRGLHVKHAVATWSLGTNSALALGPKKTMDKLDRVCRS